MVQHCHTRVQLQLLVVQRLTINTRTNSKQYSLSILVITIYNLGRYSAVLHTTCVPPPEVPQGCGLKGRGQGWTGPKRAKVAQVASVRSTGNWREVYSGGQDAWGEDGGML